MVLVLVGAMGLPIPLVFLELIGKNWGFPRSRVIKNPPAHAGDAGDARSLGWEDPLEKEMATHSSILAGRIP